MEPFENIQARAEVRLKLTRIQDTLSDWQDSYKSIQEAVNDLNTYIVTESAKNPNGLLF